MSPRLSFRTKDVLLRIALHGRAAARQFGAWIGSGKADMLWQVSPWSTRTRLWHQGACYRTGLALPGIEAPDGWVNLVSDGARPPEALLNLLWLGMPEGPVVRFRHSALEGDQTTPVGLPVGADLTRSQNTI